MAAASKVRIHTPVAPRPGGPYSQAIVANGMVYCAGQVPVDPSTSRFVEGGIQEQTHRVLQNLGAVLHAAGSDLHHVVKTTVFLANLDDFAAMNEVYEGYFGDMPPARSTVQVGLRREMLVEIECIAVIPVVRAATMTGRSAEQHDDYDLDEDRDI